MKNKIFAILIAGLLLLPLIGTASAASNQPADYVIKSYTDITITPRAEETEWHFRIVDGHTEKRLWSITYNKWLTDWINVDV